MSEEIIEREDPGFLPALPVVTETVTVTDKLNPGKSWQFRLSIPAEMSFSDLWFTQDMTERWTSEYVDGDKFVETNGQFIPIGRKLCEHIAMLFEAEKLARGHSWTFSQWVVWQHKCPNAWRDLCTFYYDMFVKARPTPDSDEDADDSADSDSDDGERTPKNA